MPNIKDISKLAGVSTATVSNVLNNLPKVTVETREKVLQVIRDTKYRPNTIAKSLKIKKTNTIGIITEDITVFNTPEIVGGINEYAENHNYHIILNNIMMYKRIGNNYDAIARYTKTVSEIVEVLVSKQVEGIIYVGAHCRDITGLIENHSVPIVYTYCYSNQETAVSIYYDDETAAYEITKYLIGLNHRKIGIVTGLLSSAQCQDRLKGYQRALYDSHLLFNPEYLKAGNWEWEMGYSLGKELLSLPDPPSAIFSMNDMMAGGIIDAAGELGVNIPKNLSLVGFDNRECSHAYSPKLTTMALPLNEIGKLGAQSLIDILSGNGELPEKTIKLRCQLIERQSVVSI